jgi:hypothetical protein
VNGTASSSPSPELFEVEGSFDAKLHRCFLVEICIPVADIILDDHLVVSGIASAEHRTKPARRLQLDSLEGADMNVGRVVIQSNQNVVVQREVTLDREDLEQMLVLADDDWRGLSKDATKALTDEVLTHYVNELLAGRGAVYGVVQEL